MPKHIVMVCRDSLESFPPVLNSIFTLAELGHRVSVISSSVDGEISKVLNKKYGVEFYLMGKISREKKIFKTLKKNVQFRRFAVNRIKYLSRHADIFWLFDKGTAVSLYKHNVCGQIKYIFTNFEIQESTAVKLIMKDFMKRAVINVVPEHSRAFLYRQWFDLPMTPFVLPNKSTEMFKEIGESLNIGTGSDSIAQLIDDIKAKANGRYILLYQGGLSKNRHIEKYIYAMKYLSGEYLLVLMGKKTPYLNELNRIYSDFYHVDYISAPLHLNISRIAHIGLVSYDFSCLNHIFCAPNKIFEYAMFALPMLGNDVAGLMSTIGLSRAGICVDFCNIENIVYGVKEINKNYKYYSNNSLSFYASVDISKLHSDLIYRYESLG